MGKVKNSAVVEVEQQYLTDLENQNHMLYQQVQDLKLQVYKLKGLRDVADYQSRLIAKLNCPRTRRKAKEVEDPPRRRDALDMD